MGPPPEAGAVNPQGEGPEAPQQQMAAPAAGHGAACGPRAVAVRLVLMGGLKQLAGAREMEMVLPPGTSVEALLAQAAARCKPDFARQVLTPQGTLQPHVTVFVNGVQATDTTDARALMEGGQVELMLLPVYEGG